MTWQVTVGGLALGDGTPYLIEQAHIYGGEDRSALRVDRPGRAGVIAPQADYLRGKPLRFVVLIAAASAAEAAELWGELAVAWSAAAADQVAAVTSPGGARHFVGRPARCDEMERGAGGGWIRAALEFAAVDPLAYSSPEYAFAEMGVMSGGLGWPAGWPWQWGTVTSGVSPWTNAGSVPSERWSVIAVARTPGATDPRFTCADGQVSLPGLSLAAGETLWLDGYARSAVVTPSVALVDSGRDVSWLIDRRFGDAWFAVPPGEHELRWSGGGDAVALVSLQSAWRV